jgi:hypothetical protein
MQGDIFISILTFFKHWPQLQIWSSQHPITTIWALTGTDKFSPLAREYVAEVAVGTSGEVRITTDLRYELTVKVQTTGSVTPNF